MKRFKVTVRPKRLLRPALFLVGVHWLVFNQGASRMRWTLAISVLLGTLAAISVYWTMRAEPSAIRAPRFTSELAARHRPTPSPNAPSSFDSWNQPNPWDTAPPLDKTTLPSAQPIAWEPRTLNPHLLAAQTAGSLGSFAEPLGALRRLTLFDAQERNWLIGELRAALLEDPVLEFFLPTRDQLVRRLELSRQVFGIDDPYTRLWELHLLRADYEHGVVGIEQAQERWLRRIAPLESLRPDWSDYLQIRKTQWFPDQVDALHHLIEQQTTSHSQHSPSTNASLETQWRHAMAIADVIRFLDRTGHVDSARLALQRLRNSARSSHHFPTWSACWTAEAELMLHDFDLPFAAGAATVALRLARQDPETPTAVIALAQAHAHCFSMLNGSAPSAIEPELAQFTHETSSPLDWHDRWGIKHHLLGPFQVPKLLTGHPANRLQRLSHVLRESRGIEPARQLQITQWILSSYPFEDSAYEAIDFVSVQALAETLPYRDWARISGLLLLAIPVCRQPEFDSHLRERLTANLTMSLERFEQITRWSSLARSQNFYQRIPLSIGVLLADDAVATSHTDTLLAEMNLRFRELPARRLRRAIAAARQTPIGRSLIRNSYLNAVRQSELFWSYQESDPLKRSERALWLINQNESLQVEILRHAAVEQPASLTELDPSTFRQNLPRSMAVADIVQMAVKEDHPHPGRALIALVHAFRNPSDSQASVFRVPLRILVIQNPSGINSFFSFSNPQDALRAIPKRQLAETALERIRNVLGPHVDQLILVPDGRSVDLPWSTAFYDTRSEESSLRQLKLAFHPYQALESSSARVEQFWVLAGGDYQPLRRDEQMTLRSLSDLPEVAREVEAIRESIATLPTPESDTEEVLSLIDRPTVQTQARELSEFRWGSSDLTKQRMLHVSGHARTIDLLDLNHVTTAFDQDELRWKSEISIWARNPWIASTLILGNEALNPQQTGEIEFPYLTASSAMFWPETPPQVVVLATCDPIAGLAQPSSAPNSVAKALWIAGVESLIASPNVVADEEPSHLFPEIYRQYQQGAMLPDAFAEVFDRINRQQRTEHPTAIRHDWYFYGP